MNHGYTGRSSAPSSLTLWGPIVAAVGSTGVLNWTWAGANPTGWEIAAGPTAGGPWTDTFFLGGAFRTKTGLTPGTYYTVRGIQSDSSPQTATSNAVLMT
jgi:hypothetical protein